LDSLAKIVEAQPVSFSSKLSRNSYYPDVFRFYLDEQTLEEDLIFLEEYQNEKLEAILHLANKYSDFGFSKLDELAISKITQKVKRLSISLEFEGIKSIETLTHLEHLFLSELVSTKTVSQKLNLNALSNLKTLSLPVRESSSKGIKFESLSGLEVLYLNHFRGKNDKYQSLEMLKNLKALNLFRCKMKDFECLSHLKKMKLLSCDYARNLSDVSSLSELRKLERLDFQNCPNLSNLETIVELPYLKVLKLNNCRSIKSLSFLQHTNLEFLEFVDTVLEDNDVAFLDKMPNLKIFRYSNKRAYTPQRKDALKWHKTALFKGDAEETWHRYCFSRDTYL